MACLTAAALQFTVQRQPAVLVPPAAPTPRELKLLSDIDDQAGLRFYVPTIQFYRRRSSASASAGASSSSNDDDDDPARVVRDAVARALTHYYPFAGRLRELEGRKLAVDCTGEGVVFVEADAADVRLEDLGDDAVRPPFPCVDELLCPLHPAALLDSPLLLVQVTRLACGGFTLAVWMQHAMADGQGLLQFLAAVAELARGDAAAVAAAAPTVRPVWARELLMARHPPRPSFAHREYDQVQPLCAGDGDVEHRYFFFGPRELAAIRAHLQLLPPQPQRRRRYTTFEILTGFLWKCRTMALAPADADEEMRLICVVSARGRGKTAGLLPRGGYGYYGNAFALPAAVARAGDLCANPVGYAVELVRQAKATAVDAEYVRSVADLMVLRGRPHFTAARSSFLLTELTRAGFGDLDFGWGRPVYGGPAKVGPGVVPGVMSFLVAYTNARGEDGVIAPMSLPAGPAMDVFVEEMRKLLRLRAPVAAVGMAAAAERRRRATL